MFLLQHSRLYYYLYMFHFSKDSFLTTRKPSVRNTAALAKYEKCEKTSKFKDIYVLPRWIQTRARALGDRYDAVPIW